VVMGLRFFGGAHIVASQTHDIGRDSRQHSNSHAGLTLVDRELAHAKV
jgi:hypothetical protein